MRFPERLRGARRALAVAAAALLFGGCGEGRRAEWSVMYGLEVRSEDAVVATWMIWGGWDEAALPEVPLTAAGPGRTLRLAAYNLDGEVIPFAGAPDHAVSYRVAEGEPTDVLDLDRPIHELVDGDRVHLYGAAPGTTRIEFALFHDGTLRQATLPIAVTVAD